MKQVTLLLVLFLGQIAFVSGVNPAVSVHSYFRSVAVFIDPEDFITKVKTYPNPIDDWMTAEFPRDVQKISVFSLTGRKVKEVTVTGDERTQISFEGLPSGYYILLFSADKGQTLGTKKVVKR